MDRFASSVPGGECATVFCGILDPGTGELRYSSAGHPPGIVAHPDGRVGTEHATATREHVARSIAASIDRARTVLGYQPRYTSLDALRESLRMLVAGGHVDVPEF